MLDALATVQIVSVPSAGNLAFEGRAVKTGQWVSTAYIDRNFLVFTPAADESGSGYASFAFKVSDGTAASTSDYTMTIDVTQVNHPATGKPEIVGAELVGWTLRASTVGIADRNGLPGTFDYQWIRVDGGTETNIAGETSSTYLLSNDDVGKTVKVKVSFTDNGGNAETATSDAIGPVRSRTTGDGSVTVEEDETYTFQASDFGFRVGDSVNFLKLVKLPFAGDILASGNKLSTADTFSETYIAAGSLAFAAAANGNGDPYTSFTFKLFGTTSDSALEAATTFTMVIKVRPVNDPPTGRPTIVGTAEVGLTLTAWTNDIADIDGLPGSFAYGWIRVDGTTEAAIEGATSGTYTPISEDQGKTIKVEVSFTDGDGTAESLTSEATGRVAATMKPTASDGSVTVNEDASYTFEAGDFGFSGVNAGDTLAGVKIVTLPSKGTLELDGAAMMANQSVTKTDIDGNKLAFTPAESGNGVAYASFTFKVNDGTQESPSAYRLTINVTPVNDAATGQHLQSC